VHRHGQDDHVRCEQLINERIGQRDGPGLLRRAPFWRGIHPGDERLPHMRRRTLSQVAFYEAVLPHLNMVERQDYDGKEGPPGHPDLKELDALTKEFIDKLLVQAATDSKFVQLLRPYFCCARPGANRRSRNEYR
jgi:hypothetical protein